MSITFADLKTAIANALADPDNATFVATTVGDFANQGLAEVGRVLPELFQEDIAPVADQMSYTLRSAVFSGAVVPEIEVARVELWDNSTTPPTQRALIPAAGDQPDGHTEAGWSNWGGTLYIPRRFVIALEGHESDWLLRVWGYSPYAELQSDSDVAPLGNEAKWAVVAYSKLLGLELMVGDRNLFQQWQTRSGASDMSPAGLMNELNFARDDWRRKIARLERLRSRV